MKEVRELAKQYQREEVLGCENKESLGDRTAAGMSKASKEVGRPGRECLRGRVKLVNLPEPQFTLL